jgi:hypothetical protein
MRLIPVEPWNETHLQALYKLLEERPAAANISHKVLPTWEEHCQFVLGMAPGLRDEFSRQHPRYRRWDLVCEENSRIVGAVYLTNRDEIGISIFAGDQRMGYASAALRMLIKECGPRDYLANVAPGNSASLLFFAKHGFIPIQHTLRMVAA